MIFKKCITITAIAIASLPLIAFSFNGEHCEKGEHGKKRHTSQHMVKLDNSEHIERMVKHLELTDAQKTQVQAVFAQTDMRNVMEQKKNIHEQIKNLDSTASSYREQLEALLSKKHALDEIVRAERYSAQKQIRNLLTDEQLAMMEHRRNKRMMR